MGALIVKIVLKIASLLLGQTNRPISPPTFSLLSLWPYFDEFRPSKPTCQPLVLNKTFDSTTIGNVSAASSSCAFVARLSVHSPCLPPEQLLFWRAMYVSFMNCRYHACESWSTHAELHFLWSQLNLSFWSNVSSLSLFNGLCTALTAHYYRSLPRNALRPPLWLASSL